MLLDMKKLFTQDLKISLNSLSTTPEKILRFITWAATCSSFLAEHGHMLIFILLQYCDYANLQKTCFKSTSNIQYIILLKVYVAIKSREALRESTFPTANPYSFKYCKKLHFSNFFQLWEFTILYSCCIALFHVRWMTLYIKAKLWQEQIRCPIVTRLEPVRNTRVQIIFLSISPTSCKWLELQSKVTFHIMVKEISLSIFSWVPHQKHILSLIKI